MANTRKRKQSKDDSPFLAPTSTPKFKQPRVYGQGRSQRQRGITVILLLYHNLNRYSKMSHSASRATVTVEVDRLKLQIIPM
jgi:hypothetical protein